jgi:hypothetical protein
MRRERDQALRWAARRLAKSSLSHDAAVELLDSIMVSLSYP